VSGFVGLDPYDVTSGINDKIPVPTLNWGFQTETCHVVISKAAIAAYEKSDKYHRVLYQIQNSNKSFAHCIFADKACAFVCASCQEDSCNKIREQVGESIAKFIRALGFGRFQSNLLELKDQPEYIKFFIGNDKIQYKNTNLFQKLVSTFELIVHFFLNLSSLISNLNFMGIHGWL